MKWLWVALTVVVVSLLAALPALADGMMTCDQTTIQSLSDCVQHARQMGHISNDGVMTSLLARTNAAQAALDRGDTATAIRLLNVFIQEVNALSGLQIEAEHASHMVMHAESVIAALQ